MPQDLYKMSSLMAKAALEAPVSATPEGASLGDSRGHTCSYHCGVDTGVENAFHYRVTCGLVVVMDGSFVVTPGCGCQ